jgi:hypothetical protein
MLTSYVIFEVLKVCTLATSCRMQVIMYDGSDQNAPMDVLDSGFLIPILELELSSQAEVLLWGAFQRARRWGMFYSTIPEKVYRRFIEGL